MHIKYQDGRYAVTDIYMLLDSGRSVWVKRDKNGDIVLIDSLGSKRYIAHGFSDDFDAVCNPNGAIHVFGINGSGYLCHICADGERLHTNVILESRGNGNKICSVRVLRINSKLHLFYCLCGKERLLVHHVTELGDYEIKPTVIDRIGKKCVYDVAKDSEDNVYIVYASDDAGLKYSKYIYNRKEHSAPATASHYDAVRISALCFGGMLFASFVASDRGRNNIYLADLFGVNCVTCAVNVRPDSLISLMNNEDTMCIQWVENQMCFSVDCMPSLDISKVKILGKSIGMIRNGSCNTYLESQMLAVSQSGKPFVAVRTILKKSEPRYEVEEIASRYMDVLSKPHIMENDFKYDLMMIEASLEKLIKLIENALEKSVIMPKEEYNIEDIKEEESADE